MLMPTPDYRSESFFERRFPLLIGVFLLALFAVVAGLLFLPFSGVLVGLLFFLVGSFFLVALVVISAAWFHFAVTVFGAIRRTLLGSDHAQATSVSSKSEDRPQEPGFSGGRSDLWDRWLDGP
jgi:hypothetical protein